MGKVAYILGWFERYRTDSRRTAAAATSAP
jgi:hypothetical protein